MAVLKATALEILSEPLSLLILLFSLALAVLAPTFHYHQFGEATRMARDAGLSALFMGGLVLAVFGTIRAFRREIESGTLEMALAHPISRRAFFLGKTAGAFLAYLVFALIVFSTTLVLVEGAAVGGVLARETGDVARIWGPAVAAGVAVIFLPILLGAALNRFGRFRFVLTAFVTAAILAVLLAGAALSLGFRLLLPYFMTLVPILAWSLLFLVASAALAVRFKANAAAAVMGVVFLATLPFVGTYYLADQLTNGGTIALAQLICALGGLLPAVAACLILGEKWTSERT